MTKTKQVEVPECECEGTGKVPNFALEGNEWIVDGEKDCICIINQKEND